MWPPVGGETLGFGLGNLLRGEITTKGPGGKGGGGKDPCRSSTSQCPFWTRKGWGGCLIGNS